MKKIRKDKVEIFKKKTGDSEALSFIASGVACYAFSLLDEMGIIDLLHKKGQLPISNLRSYPNPLVLQIAFETLGKNNIVKYHQGSFYLTEMGDALLRHRGSIGLIYNGYRNILSNQLSIASGEPSQNWDLIDSLAISKASVYFGEKIINDLILNILLDCQFKGICDLGCGEAKRLIYICRKTGLKGLGIDFSEQSIHKGSKHLKKCDKIELIVGDITKIDKNYSQFEVLLQSFVLHDLTGDLYEKTLRSYLTIFPNMKMFIYIDAFACPDSRSMQLPGFDYIHGLLNIKTRTRKETMSILKKVGFNIANEYEIRELPNCYMWVLKPTERSLVV